MPRIEFDGEGLPIPTIALPPFGSDSDLSPTVLTFTEDADFSVVDYMALGFTHFEAWCVGAAGGRGGDSTYADQTLNPAPEQFQFVYAVEEVNRPVPLSVWNLALEAESYDDYAQQASDNFHGLGPAPVLNRVYHPEDYRWSFIIQSLIWPTWPGSSPAWVDAWSGTYKDAVNLSNPNRLLRFRTIRQIAIQPSNSGMGGGGGGGGLHKVVGALSDLSSVEPIVVGKVGADAGYGQVRSPGIFEPTIAGADFSYWTGSPIPPYTARQAELAAYFVAYLNSYPLPHVSYFDPQPGENGGTSSFGDVCQASGGEGGAPGRIWDAATSKFILKGEGGDGGVGGSLVAGGGGAGSVAEGVNGFDGIWHPETGIGGGGGGGKGGRASEGGLVGGGLLGSSSPVINHLATAGGQGSYSFADTSVYGARQFRQAWVYVQKLNVFANGLRTGVFTEELHTTTQLIIPGTGGGARPFPNMKYGGRGSGFSPDGIVILRLTQIT